MSVQLHVPSIVCEACANAVTKAITNLDAQAKVDVNVETKQVQVETAATEAALKEAIVAVGHTVE